MNISFVWIFYKAGNILENAVYLFVQWIYCQIYHLSTFKELNEAPARQSFPSGLHNINEFRKSGHLMLSMTPSSGVEHWKPLVANWSQICFRGKHAGLCRYAVC